MDLDLDEVDASDAPPADPDRGTEHTLDDFNVGDLVLVWQARTWWHGKVVYKSRVGSTLSVRFTGARDQISGILPQNVKHAER